MKEDKQMIQDKVIIIAGGCGLLGSTFAKAVLENGGICVLADLFEQAGEEKVRELVGMGFDKNKILFSPLDLTDKESILSGIQNIDQRFGSIDACVNTAYPRTKNWGKKIFGKVEYQDFCQNAGLHLGGYFLLAQEVCEYFKKQAYGNLVQIASIQGVMAPKFDTYREASFKGFEMNSPAEYSVFKAGIINFTRYIAKYYKGYNIRSNCISPGGILDGQPEVFLEKYKEYCLTKGMLDPEDICGTLIYLLSDMSMYVNGQNIIVDDGWSL